MTIITKCLAVLMLAAILQAQVPENQSDFSELLRKMNESSVSELATDPTALAYRVIYDAALRMDSPFVVRVELNKEGKASVVTKWLTGLAKRPESRMRTISTAEFRSFNELVAKSSFWQSQQQPLNPIFDGDTWLLEAVQEGRYHRLVVQVPSSKNVVRMIGERMLVLGKSPVMPPK